MLFSIVPFSVAIPVGVKVGGAPTATVATTPANVPCTVGGLPSNWLMDPFAFAVM
jgi:hypothetical protein